MYARVRMHAHARVELLEITSLCHAAGLAILHKLTADRHLGFTHQLAGFFCLADLMFVCVHACKRVHMRAHVDGGMRMHACMLTYRCTDGTA